MASPFALPASERQAFFTLLDEYFSSRPHVLDHFQTPLAPSVTAAPTVSTTSDTPLAGKKAAPPPPPRRSNSTMSSASTPAPPYSPPVDHLASEMEDKAHVSSVHHGIRKPAGLTTTKSIGFLDTSSKGAAVRSVIGHAVKRPEDRPAPGAGDYYTSPPAVATPSTSTYPTAAPVSTPASAVSSSFIGTAEALYTFAGTEPGDLHVEKGETIHLLEKVSADWYRAQSADGTREGIVPTNYIQVS
ncbi:hypothetical protein ACI68E_001663 [Malassezia pachydermatis]|uniref:Rhogef domain-containing protein gxci-like isoform x1 n=1 Tax=Malassezia pachydermatis TaxID=77020 RepID=A0A0M8MTQ9_9BASI|nr:rhogef domain-containing protein gxci-like isoform x1 [Malassezia pachydermatis]KOS16577.1 rhogef domain-containing protein gxci-like isoform x1 [Malassezia pachydermatis]